MCVTNSNSKKSLKRMSSQKFVKSNKFDTSSKKYSTIIIKQIE